MRYVLFLIIGFSQVAIDNTNVYDCLTVTPDPTGDFTQKVKFIVSVAPGCKDDIVGYSFVKGNDPNNSVLNNFSTSNTSAEFKGFGPYQIRVKLKNGSQWTISYNYDPDPIFIFTTTDFDYCKNKLILTPSVKYDLTGGNAPETDYIDRLKYKFYYLNSNNDTITLAEGIYRGTNIEVDASFANLKENIRGYFKAYNGAVSKNRFGYNFDVKKREVKISGMIVGCPPQNKSLNIKMLPNYNVKDLTLYRKNDNGDDVIVDGWDYANSGNPITKYSLDPSAEYYIVANDYCEPPISETYELPSYYKEDTQTHLSVTDIFFGTYNGKDRNCLPNASDVGSGRIAVNIAGYIPDLENATITIIEGPSNLGTEGVYIPKIGAWGFTNITPGNYRVRITNTCGDVIEADLNVPSSIRTASYRIDSYLSYIDCTGASGSIKTDALFELSGRKYIQLLRYTEGMDISDPNLEVVREEASGTFSNVPTGEYITRGKVELYCGGNVYIPGNKISIKKPNRNTLNYTITPIKCTNGSVLFYFHVTGWTPYTCVIDAVNPKTKHKQSFEYKSTTVEFSYKLNGLEDNDFTITIKDDCGNSVVADTYSYKNIKGLTVNILNTKNPNCVAEGKQNPYTLEATKIPNAKYNWYRKDLHTGEETLVFSDNGWTNSLKFANFTAQNAGIYRVEVQLHKSDADCFSEWVSSPEKYIYANMCGGDIGSGTIAGTVVRSTTPNSVNGYDITSIDDKNLYVVLLNNDGDKIISYKRVTNKKREGNFDYSFIFKGISNNPNSLSDAQKYKLVITTEPSLTTLNKQLSGGWQNSGEALGSTKDGSADGTILVKPTQTNVKFGLYAKICTKLPVSNGNIYFPKVGITSLERYNNSTSNEDLWLKHHTGAVLVLESKENGFVINRVKNPTRDIKNPVEGMLVYDTTNDCLSLYANGKWNCLEQDCIDNN